MDIPIPDTVICWSAGKKSKKKKILYSQNLTATFLLLLACFCRFPFRANLGSHRLLVPHHSAITVFVGHHQDTDELQTKVKRYGSFIGVLVVSVDTMSRCRAELVVKSSPTAKKNCTEPPRLLFIDDEQ